jgi:hypothetical protein
LSKLRHKLNQPELIGFSSVDLERWRLSRGQILQPSEGRWRWEHFPMASRR